VVRVGEPIRNESNATSPGCVISGFGRALENRCPRGQAR